MGLLQIDDTGLDVASEVLNLSKFVLHVRCVLHNSDCHIALATTNNVDHSKAAKVIVLSVKGMMSSFLHGPSFHLVDSHQYWQKALLQ